MVRLCVRGSLPVRPSFFRCCFRHVCGHGKEHYFSEIRDIIPDTKPRFSDVGPLGPEEGLRLSAIRDLGPLVPWRGISLQGIRKSRV